MRSLVWFKQDLRSHDNPALYHACEDSKDGVIALYLITPTLWQKHDDAAIKIEFWRRNLISLQQTLAELNIPLLIETVEATTSAEEIMLKICETHNVDSVFFNRSHEPNEEYRDKKVINTLSAADITCETFIDQFIISPKTLLTKQGTPYTVFTPFKKTWLAQAENIHLTVYTKPKKQTALAIQCGQIPNKIPGFESNLDETLWPIGESAALGKLAHFIETGIKAYDKQRDFPISQGTSLLSPYLTAGIVSTKQCLIAAINANHHQLIGKNEGVNTWISELIWREFYRYIMVHFPKVGKHQPFQPKTQFLKWNQSEKLLIAWQQGKTGIPIVDAAMRQLNTTGWMHNRLRMITAMFLAKNLLLDWRLGEKYFMQHLIDGDLASNNGGWQWSASTGTDAAPYFRIMNPITQSQRFDSNGDFIRRYCPELAELDEKSIHNPYELSPLISSTLDYPEPIVDLHQSRLEAIEAFKKL